jgi:gas vesicle protein
MLKLIIGAIIGFICGSFYGLQFAVKLGEDNKFMMVTKIIKMLWEVARS